MTWLGIRCWKDKIAMAVVVDDPVEPQVGFERPHSMPKGETDVGQQAHWFFRVVDEALTETSAAGLAIFVSSGEIDQSRAIFEGAASASAGARRVPVRLLRKQAMWKPLGIADAKGASWSAFMKDDRLFGQLVADTKEAAAASHHEQDRS